MGKATTPVSMIVYLLLWTLPGPSLSQTQEPPPPDESQWQQMRQLRDEQQRQRAAEGRQRMAQQQEEFWRRVDEQARQRLQEDWPSLTEEERQRRQESLRKSEEQHQQMMQHQRESWQRQAQQQKQNEQRLEELRRKRQEEQKLIKKVADEYADEVWREALGAAPEQWQAIKPQLERIHQLKDPLYVDVSVYWLAGSIGYQEESLVGSPEGPQSVAKAFGWFSVTSGAGSTSESYTRSGADGDDRIPPLESGHSSSRYGQLTSGQYSAMRRSATGPEDSNRVPTSRGFYRAGNARARAVAHGTIQFGMQLPGPVKKQVGDIDLGWLWEKPSLAESPETLSEGEKACERLVDLFETKGPDPEQVRQRVEALRQVRAQRQAELREAQRQLREVITPQQEPKLILMGYLD